MQKLRDLKTRFSGAILANLESPKPMESITNGYEFVCRYPRSGYMSKSESVYESYDSFSVAGPSQGQTRGLPLVA